jgi:serine/threonine protein phosphatase PrpC
VNAHIDPLAIGDPGRAAVAVTARPDHRFPFRRGMVLDGVRVTGRSQVDGLEVRAASVRGLAHQYYGTTRQDEFAFLVTGDGRWLVASVADGVSAGEHSHRAAEVVSHAGCRRVAELLGEVEPGDLDWPAIFQELAGDVIACAERELSIVDLRTAAGSMAATALFAVVAVDIDENGGRSVHTMSLGDTSAWLLRPDGWLPLREVKNAGSAIVSAVTAAIPRVPRELPPAVPARLDPDGVLVLMSDGVGDPLGDGTGEVGARLAEAWRRPPDPLNFAAQVGFARRSFDDDRTVLAIWPVRGQS